MSAVEVASELTGVLLPHASAHQPEALARECVIMSSLALRIMLLAASCETFHDS